jgi:hypothetical protein
MSTEGIAKDFVCTGYVVLKGFKKGVSLRTLDADGKCESREWLFESKKVKIRCGQVYTGAQFTDTSVINLQKVRWIRTWEHEADRLAWAAREQESLAEIAAQKMQTDATKVDELERALLPLRREYQRHAQRFDAAGMRAFESSVMAALRVPLRSYEQ